MCPIYLLVTLTSSSTWQGVSRAVTCLLIVASLKLFPVLVSSLQMGGCFFLYCGVVAASLPLVMTFLPETKGRVQKFLLRKLVD